VANQKVTINGKTFGVWFKHVQDDGTKETKEVINKALGEAIRCGQIKKFGRIDHDPRPEHYFPLVKTATVCFIETDDDSHATVSTGYSFCSVSEKRFIKSDARNRSLGRAVGAYWKFIGGKKRNRSDNYHKPYIKHEDVDHG